MESEPLEKSGTVWVGCLSQAPKIPCIWPRPWTPISSSLTSSHVKRGSLAEITLPLLPWLSSVPGRKHLFSIH